MLNAKALSEILSQNTDDRLCKRWFIFTPRGTLLAYSKTSNIRDLRRQAAKSALLWQEQLETQHHEGFSAVGQQGKAAPSQPRLTTLTVEAESGNTIIRQIQPELLLVLEGGVPPRKRTFEPRVTAEGPGDLPYPGAAGAPSQSSQPGSFVSSSGAAESVKGNAPHGVLLLQRKKVDALAAAIADGFEKTGFKMPEEGNAKVF